LPAIPSSIGPARLQSTAGGLSIVIPARFSWYTLLHAPLVAVFVLWYVQKAHENSAVVLVVFAALLAFSLRRWWRNVVGEQTVTVNRIAITVRSNVGFFGREHIYFVKRICNLRFVRIVTSADRQAGLGNRPSLGYLTFYYESSTHRLAGRFTDSEAQELIALLESFAAAPLTGIHTAPDHPLPPQVIAEEVHRGRGAIILYGWLGCAIYAICLPIDDIAAVRVVSTILAFLALAVGILAECGYRYRFTSRGLEISTLGFPLRFIPVDQILHYEPAKWTPRDRWNFGIYGRRRSFVWGGPGLRIETLDGQVYLGHEFPEKIVALFDQMKQSSAQPAAQPTAKAATAAAR
jgi:hypothetical protein